MTDVRFKLNSGHEIPALGLGTWKGEGSKVASAVSYALQQGYRLIDCAYAYANETDVGAGLREAFDSGVVKREDVFVATKLWCTHATRVEENLDRSLKNLGLDYVDLYLVHWPINLNPNGNHELFPTLPDGYRDVIRDHDHLTTWKQMEALLATGKVKAIGVCNYSKRYLEELLAGATVAPAVNQVELHPALPQHELIEFCKSKGIHVEAYSPLGSSGAPLAEIEAVKQVAERKGVSPHTVLLSYHVSRGITVLAKSVTPERITANMQVVRLDDEDFSILNEHSAKLEKEEKLQRFVYPLFKTDLGFPDRKAPF